MKPTKAHPIQPLAWRVNDACQRLSISRATVYKMVKMGRLRLIKIAGRTLIPDSEIERLAAIRGPER